MKVGNAPESITPATIPGTSNNQAGVDPLHPGNDERMIRMKRAYYKDPNRWMINHVPVMQERHIDWISIMGFIIAIGFIVWFTWLLWTV